MSDVVSIGKQLKVLVRECTENGTILDRPKYLYFTDNGDNERDDVAVRLTRLILDTTYFNMVTKIFVSNLYMSKVEAGKELEKHGVNMPKNTVTTRIRNDLLKFCRDFGSKIIIDIFEDKSASMSKYNSMLNELEANSNKKKCELDSLRALKIPAGFPNSSVDISDEQLREFIEIIRPYTEVFMSNIENRLNRNVCYYVRQLLSDGALGEKETRHLGMLRELLSDKGKEV